MTIDKQVERLRVEPHETDSDHVMVEKQITEALQDAYIRGAEAMRFACQQWCRAWENNGEAIADALADLSIPEEP